MKLLYCAKCKDVIKLIEAYSRECECGESEGFRGDSGTVYVYGPCNVIGVDDDDFNSALQKWVDGPTSTRGVMAYLLAHPCSTVVRETENG